MIDKEGKQTMSLVFILAFNLEKSDGFSVKMFLGKECDIGKPDCN